MNTKAVFVWHDNSVERIYFTVTRARLNVSCPNRNQVASLPMGGTVNIWVGRELREVI